MSYTSSTGYDSSGWVSRNMTNLTRSRTLRDCRTYYRIALYSLSLTIFLDVLSFVLSFFKFALFDIIYFASATLWLGFLAACIYFLKKYSNMPDSTHWLTHAQSHITLSSIIAFLLFSYSGSLRAPWSTSLKVCLPTNVKDLIGSARCNITSIIGAISWVAPLSMFIAAWVIYFSSIAAVGYNPVPLSAGVAGVTWRHVNVAEVNESEGGEVSLP